MIRIQWLGIQLRSSADFTSVAVELQAFTTRPGLFVWVLGTEFGSFCLHSKHLINWVSHPLNPINQYFISIVVLFNVRILFWLLCITFFFHEILVLFIYCFLDFIYDLNFSSNLKTDVLKSVRCGQCVRWVSRFDQDQYPIKFFVKY